MAFHGLLQLLTLAGNKAGDSRNCALCEENETLEVHTLADEIDLLLEGFMDRICKATGRTREELQRELEMVELEEET